MKCELYGLDAALDGVELLPGNGGCAGGDQADDAGRSQCCGSQPGDASAYGVVDRSTVKCAPVLSG